MFNLHTFDHLEVQYRIEGLRHSSGIRSIGIEELTTLDERDGLLVFLFGLVISRQHRHMRQRWFNLCFRLMLDFAIQRQRQIVRYTG